MEKTYTFITTEFSIQILETGWISEVILNIKMAGEKQKTIKLKCTFTDKEEIGSSVYSGFETSYTFQKPVSGEYYFSYWINNIYHETNKVAFIVCDYDSSPKS